jgi:hypothetical protein
MQDDTVYKAELKQPAGRRSHWPVLLVAAGVLLLLPHFVGDSLWAPVFFLVAPGLLLLWPAHRSTAEARSSLGFLAIPGAVLLATGVLLAVMAVTYHYDSWAYAWTLLPAAAVGGAMYMKRYDPDHAIHRTGHKLVRVLILTFMVLAILFELFVFRGLGAWWPLILVAAGAYLWLRERRR